jgi:hypothetical protein
MELELGIIGGLLFCILAILVKIDDTLDRFKEQQELKSKPNGQNEDSPH